MKIKYLQITIRPHYYPNQVVLRISVESTNHYIVHSERVFHEDDFEDTLARYMDEAKRQIKEEMKECIETDEKLRQKICDGMQDIRILGYSVDELQKVINFARSRGYENNGEDD